MTHQGLSPQDVELLLEAFARGLEGVTDVRDREEVQDAVEDLRADLSAEVVEPSASSAVRAASTVLRSASGARCSPQPRRHPSCHGVASSQIDGRLW